MFSMPLVFRSLLGLHYPDQSAESVQRTRVADRKDRSASHARPPALTAVEPRQPDAPVIRETTELSTLAARRSRHTQPSSSTEWRHAA